MPRRKESTDNSLLSSKPTPTSAVLTFVPDDEVNKIVTRPLPEDSASPHSEKHRLLRDRKSTGQDYSCTSRRKLSVVLNPLNIHNPSSSSVPITKCNKKEPKVTEGAKCTTEPLKQISGTEERTCSASTTGDVFGIEKPLPSAEDESCVADTIDSVNMSKDSSLSCEKTVATNGSSTSKNQSVEGKVTVGRTVNETNSCKNNRDGIKILEATTGNAANSSSTVVPPHEVEVAELSKPKDVTCSTISSASEEKVTSVKTESETEVNTGIEGFDGPVFRLGMEGNYSSYVNQFATNPQALNKLQQLEQRDKKRSVTHKFSISEFKWHGDVFGSRDVILNTLRFSIVGLENLVPSAFMHPLWPLQRSTWVKAVHMSKTSGDFAASLSFLESFIRPICFLPVWNDAAGHVELHRVVSEARQAGAKKKEHKEEEEEPELEHKGFGRVQYSTALQLIHHTCLGAATSILH